MSKTKRQHYVPRFYLDAWSDAETGLIRQYDLVRSKENHVSPTNTALKKWVYELSEPRDFPGGTQAVEQWFSVLEGQVAAVARQFISDADEFAIDGARSQMTMLKSQQRVLAQFIVTLLRRHPDEVDASAKAHEELLRNLGYVRTPSGLYVSISAEDTSLMGRDLALASLTEPLRHDHPILSWAWRGFTLPKGVPHHFITSDRPVVPIADVDGGDFLGFQLALSPRHLLTCTPERYGEIEQEGFVQTFCRRAVGATPKPRFIYSTPSLDPVEPTAEFSALIAHLADQFG